jgi:hypothetical protein
VVRAEARPRRVRCGWEEVQRAEPGGAEAVVPCDTEETVMLWMAIALTVTFLIAGLVMAIIEDTYH